jgi:glycosidase
MDRFYSVVKEDFSKYKAGMALLLTTRGIPQMYYGDEILMSGYSNPDGLVRSDFPGGFPGDKVNKFTAAGRTDKENEAFNYVRTLANYRKNTPALQTGKLMQYIPQNNIYVYFRYNAAKTVMVIYNSDTKPQTLKTDRFSERMAGYTGATNVITNEPVGSVQSIDVPGKTTLVLELKK